MDRSHRASSVPPQSTRPPLRIVDESPRFAQLWESVLYDPNLKPSDVKVYAILQRMVHEQRGDLAPSHKEIAERANMDRGTVSASLASLQKYGHIKRTQRSAWESDVIVLVQPKPHRAEKPRIDGEESPNADAGNPSNDVGEKPRNLLERDIESTEESPPVVPQGTETVDDPEDEDEDDGYTPEYEAFWGDYPKRANNSKARGFVAWKKLTVKQRRRAHAALPRHKATAEWRRGIIPHTSTYLNGKLWQTDLPEDEPKNAADPMAAWVLIAEEIRKPGSSFPDGKIPKRIWRAAEAIGGIDAIDITNSFHRSHFMAAYREVAS